MYCTHKIYLNKASHRGVKLVLALVEESRRNFGTNKIYFVPSKKVRDQEF